MKEESNEYTFNTQDNYYDLKGMKYGWFKYCPHYVAEIDLIGATSHAISQWYYLSKTTTKTYGSAGIAPVTEVTSYFYDNPAHIQPTRIQTLNSDGSIRQVRTTYPQDYNPVAGSSDPMMNALFKMIQKNIVATPVEQMETVIKNGQEMIIAASLNTFKEFTNDHIYPAKSYQLEIGPPLPMCR